MTSPETASNTENSTVKRQHRSSSFAKVCDGRKQPIRGLWIRNDRYYGQLKVEDPLTGIKKTRRVPLLDTDRQPVKTAAQAVAELKRLQIQRADNQLPVLRRTPKFSEYVKTYLDFISAGHGTKKQSTIQKETSTLDRWIEFLKDLKIDQIKRVHVNRFIEWRLTENVAPRTINLDVISLRVVLKKAIQDGLLQRLPTEGLRPLRYAVPVRALFTSQDLEKLCSAAFEIRKDENNTVAVTKNAQEFVDYVRLMAYSGARRNEALQLRWDDVDSTNKQLIIGARGDTKNRTGRVVDFNPKLEKHLLEMKTRNGDVSKWLFPSPQRGEKDIPTKTFRESLTLVRTQAKMQKFTFHDCRHHFISMCVMAGVDFMTIAAWVGHRDGGVLIGKVYGHLANEHRKVMAQRVTFEATK